MAKKSLATSITENLQEEELVIANNETPQEEGFKVKKNGRVVGSTVSIHLQSDLLKDCKELAERKYISFSALVNLALGEYVAREKKREARAFEE